MPRSKTTREKEEMRAVNFIREVKAAVSGGWPKPETKPRKIKKTPEQIWEEVNN